MDGTLELITAPASEPVTVIEAKAWARVTTDEDDSLIDALTSTARAHVEELTGRALLTQTWDYWLDRFPCGELAVPRPLLRTVTYIKYIDQSGALITLDSSKYTVDAKRIPGRIVPSYGNVWPSARGVPNAINVRFDAGFGAASESVPLQLRQAILVLVATLYEQREHLTEAALQDVPVAFWQLINQHRVWWL